MVERLIYVLLVDLLVLELAVRQLTVQDILFGIGEELGIKLGMMGVGWGVKLPFC